MNKNPYQFKKFVDTLYCSAGQQVADFMNENLNNHIGIMIQNLSYTTKEEYGKVITVAHLLYTTCSVNYN